MFQYRKFTPVCQEISTLIYHIFHSRMYHPLPCMLFYHDPNGKSMIMNGTGIDNLCCTLYYSSNCMSVRVRRIFMRLLFCTKQPARHVLQTAQNAVILLFAAHGLRISALIFCAPGTGSQPHLLSSFYFMRGPLWNLPKLPDLPANQERKIRWGSCPSRSCFSRCRCR